MPIHNYTNFDLLITQTTDSYTAHVIDSPVGEATTPFTIDLTPAELRNFFWLSGRALRHFRPAADIATPPPLDPQQFGQRLYDAVFSGPIRTQLRRSLDAVATQGKGLRIRLRLSNVPELAELPWEYLYATDDLDRALATATATPIVRYLDLAQPEAPLTMRPPLRILGIVANPQGTPPLNVEHEWRQLHDALADLASRQLLTLERLTTPTLAALQSRLRGAPIHVIHFIGHGDFDDTAAGGLLLLEDEVGQPHPVSADGMATLLHNHKPLRLAFLNACQGAQGARSNPFGGVAQKLVQQGLPSVLAMQFPVSDHAAITLAHTFYRALADGAPIDAATSEARNALYLAGNEREWGTPVLFTRADDNRLIELPSGDFRPTIARQDWEPETVLIPGGPFLMGSDVDEENERPQQTVELPDFRIGKTPVTNAQYAEFLAKNPEQPEPRKVGWFLRKPPAGKEEHPVVSVSWHDGVAYCQWLSEVTGRTYRLPSEAEWEKAARGTDGRRYPWGNEWQEGIANLDGDETTPVAAHPNGTSPDGCLDMLGNVQEWVGTEAGWEERVVRGGSYRSAADEVRCSARGAGNEASRVPWRGFRVVMEIVEAAKGGE